MKQSTKLISVVIASAFLVPSVSTATTKSPPHQTQTERKAEVPQTGTTHTAHHNKHHKKEAEHHKGTTAKSKETAGKAKSTSAKKEKSTKPKK